jgi:hypothetical protein
MAPRESPHSPGPGPKGKDPTDSSPSGHPSTDHDDLETHYAALERLEPPHGCIAGVVYIGHLVVGEDGEEAEVFEAVPCTRCSRMQ